MSSKCKRCGSQTRIKNGIVQTRQRYKCKDCAYNYIDGDKRQKYTIKDKLKVIKLYLENNGIRTIERLTGIYNSQISKWILSFTKEIKDKLLKVQNNIHSAKDISVLEIDELCTYIKKSQRMEENLLLYGLLLIEDQVKLLILK